MGLKKHKKLLENQMENLLEIASDIDSKAPRQLKEPIYREDTDIALATKTHVIESGKRIGKNVEIIPYEQDVDFIDIHSEFELWLSEKIIKRRK